MNASSLAWVHSLATHGRNSLSNVKTRGCKWLKRLSRKYRESKRRESHEQNHGELQDDYFAQKLRAELHRVVDSIQPRDTLAEILERIRGALDDKDIPRDGNQDR